MALPHPRRKDIPRLPLSVFSPPNTGTSDTFPIPPTPTLITPAGIVDAHLQIDVDTASGIYVANIVHLKSAREHAAVLSPTGHSAFTIVNSLQSLQSNLTQTRILAVLIPFSLETHQIPDHIFAAPLPLAFTTIYDGTLPVAPEAEEEAGDQAPEIPVKNLRWALQFSRLLDFDIADAAVAPDPSLYDSLVNLLAKSVKPETNPKHTPIILTNLLPPPLDSVTPVVSLMNHPTYTTYRQRVSSLSLFENVSVKLLPPVWMLAESTSKLEPEREKELREILKLFIVPILEAFGFERIIFGCSPPSTTGSPALADMWCKLVLESCRELAVSQDEMDQIFMNNAKRIYG